jgi:glycosyltransferase involved in cell wall biosynthesis
MALPSIEEGLALVMAEALACGCPVIATQNTGASDLYGHEREGFIVPIRDAAAITSCLVRLADEPELRARMSSAALDRVKTIGGWEKYGDAYVEWIEKCRHRFSPSTSPGLAPISESGRA